MPLSQYRNFSWVYLSTKSWLGVEHTSDEHWKELPDDYVVPGGGMEPSNFCILVGGGDEEVSHKFSGHRFFTDPFYSIDVCR